MEVPDNMNTRQSCSNCALGTIAIRFEPNGPPEERLECRRYPPQMLAHSDGLVDIEFPTMFPNEWCGEWASITPPTRRRHPPQRRNALAAAIARKHTT